HQRNRRSALRLRCQTKRVISIGPYHLALLLLRYIAGASLSRRAVLPQAVTQSGGVPPSRFHMARVIRCWLAYSAQGSDFSAANRRRRLPTCHWAALLRWVSSSRLMGTETGRPGRARTE